MDKDLLNFKKNGWIVEKSLFKKDEIEIIKFNIKNFLDKNLQKYSGRDINFIDKNPKIEHLNSFHKMDDCKFIKELAFSKKIYDIPKKYLDTAKPDLRACELFAKPKFKGLQAPVHQDNYYWCVNDANALTIWLSLDKSNIKNGGVFYYDGSHMFGTFEHTESFAKGSSQMIKNISDLDKFKKSYPELEIGDCLIHHSLVAHGSDLNISESDRTGLTFQFKSEKSYYDDKLKKSYETSLMDQLDLRGK